VITTLSKFKLIAVGTVLHREESLAHLGIILLIMGKLAIQAIDTAAVPVF
jgi:hypothetical protein